MAKKSRKNNKHVDEVEEENDSQDENTQNDEPALIPKKVDYCPHCRYVVEYCEFSNCFEDKCLPYLKEKFPDLANTLEELKKDDKYKDKTVKSKKEAGPTEAKGGEVFVATKKRSARKFLTFITGLENYNVDLAATAQLFKKKFACGTAVIQDPHLGLEIQGDVKRDLLPIMVNEWKIPNKMIWTEYKITHEDGSSEKKRILVSEFLKMPEKRNKEKVTGPRDVKPNPRGGGRK